MARTAVIMELTVEEAALLAGLLVGSAAESDRRTAILAMRMLARIEAQVGDVLAVRTRFKTERQPRTSREHDCPIHQRPLRLDRSSLATLMRVYYCPVSGCEYLMETQP